MKSGSKGPLPWDIAVFLTVTLVGFGYTVQKFSRTLAPLRSSEVRRTVASTLSAPTPMLVAASTTGARTLDLGCLESRALAERISVESVPFRMKGRLCEQSGAGTLRVRNLSNGTEVTVFFRGDGSSFITDHLSLMSGANHVQIEWKPSDQLVSRAVLADVVSEAR